MAEKGCKCDDMLLILVIGWLRRRSYDKNNKVTNQLKEANKILVLSNISEKKTSRKTMESDFEWAILSLNTFFPSSPQFLFNLSNGWNRLLSLNSSSARGFRVNWFIFD